MIYWDSNAGAPLLPHIAERIAAILADSWGNPSSVHQAGRKARKHLDEAREQVASIIGCTPREIAFTGSASEAAAIAIMGAWRGRKETSKKRIVTTTIEHPCVLGAVKQLEAEGANVIRIGPEPDGRVSTQNIIDALTGDTVLCSMQWVNNETGVIQPVEEISRWCAQRNILFHTDAAQAFGKIPASLRECPADFLSLSAHKLGGPPGTGALFARRGANTAPLIPGHQENGRRGGTQSTANAVGLAMALEHANTAQQSTALQLTALRDSFVAHVCAALPNTEVNGSAARVCNTANLYFPGVDGEALLIGLDLAGICVSSGAACASGTLSPSHVLLAMGRTSAQASGSIRFSLGSSATPAEVERVAHTVTALVKQQQSA